MCNSGIGKGREGGKEEGREEGREGGREKGREEGGIRRRGREGGRMCFCLFVIQIYITLNYSVITLVVQSMTTHSMENPGMGMYSAWIHVALLSLNKGK